MTKFIYFVENYFLAQFKDENFINQPTSIKIISMVFLCHSVYKKIVFVDRSAIAALLHAV